MTDTLQRVLNAQDSLTLAGVPSGFLPVLAADLARAAHGSSRGGRVYLSHPTRAQCARSRTPVPLFAPEVEVLTLPAWDCLPYDRTSPALRVMAERLATLNAFRPRPRDLSC
jgi:transcription-repair coupling factor (superfamily II helicase)